MRSAFILPLLVVMTVSCGDSTPPGAQSAVTVSAGTGPESGNTSPTLPVPSPPPATNEDRSTPQPDPAPPPTTTVVAEPAVEGTPIRAGRIEPNADGLPAETDGAALVGSLVFTDNCFAIDSGSGPPTPVIWPHDTVLEGGRFTAQSTSFVVGDEMYLGGGSTPAVEKVVLPELLSEAERCSRTLGQSLFNAGSINRAEDVGS